MFVAGADIWRGRWVAVALRDGCFESAIVVSSVGAVLQRLPELEVLGVDVPIGLPPAGRRRPADLEARNAVGPRWASVFLTPSEDLLRAASCADANRVARADGRDGISAQAYGLAGHILAVQPVARLDGRIYEVHPEVSFASANGGQALAWSKATWNGVSQRRRLLQSHGIDVPDRLEEAGGAGFADVLDAAIVAWSADRIASGRAERLPPGRARIGAIWR